MRVSKPFLKKLSANPESVLKTLKNEDIAKIIQEANYHYCNTSTPILTDKVYDIVFDHLKQIDPNHPVLKQVGSCVAVHDMRKEKLPYYMGSLDKIKNNDPVGLDKFKQKYPGNYVISDKLDGNSALLVVDDNGVKLYTRGDGKVGQNITGILNYIKGIPTKLKNMAVRGELIISREDFEKVKHKGANARNMVAGVINAKIPDMEILQLVQFMAYEQIHPDTYSIDQQLKNLKCAGFRTVYHQIVSDFTESSLSEILVDRRKNSPFEVDGIVLFHVSLHKRKTGDNPDYAFAFKSLQTMEKVDVIVSEVEWNITKDGYMIPVIKFPPVPLNGVTIQRSHGFNGKYIKDNKIGPGSRLTIMRSGDVIPYVSEVLSPATSGSGQMPDITYGWSASGVDIVAKGDEAISQTKLKSLEYFFDKIDVKGVSAGNIKKLFDSGLTSVKAIFEASIDDLKRVEGFKEKMAQKVFDALKERYVTLENNCVLLMDASNMLGRGMGSKKIELIVNSFPNILSERYIPTIGELTNIKGIEKKSASQFIDNLPACFKFLDENGFVCKSKSKEKSADKSLAGMNVVFTGIRNKEIEQFIVSNGGKVSSSVSKNTTLVIAKDPSATSGSITKATDLGINVISVGDFQKKYMNIL